jgi:hypothetical protein
VTHIETEALHRHRGSQTEGEGRKKHSPAYIQHHASVRSRAQAGSVSGSVVRLSVPGVC